MKITVKVKPNAKQQKIETLEDGSLRVSLKSSPLEGKANQELIAILAKKFGVNKSQVVIKLGQTSKSKVIEILE
ncbi:MAG: DUF167 domain-containing protein [Microcystaceae cyanobacterium]